MGGPASKASRVFASGIWSIERNSLSSRIHLICASGRTQTGKWMTIKYSVPDCGVGAGAVGTRPGPGQAFTVSPTGFPEAAWACPCQESWSSPRLAHSNGPLGRVPADSCQWSLGGLGWLSKAPEESEGSLQRGSVTCPAALAEDTGQLQKQIREVEGGLWVALEGGWGWKHLVGLGLESQAWWKSARCPLSHGHSLVPLG